MSAPKKSSKGARKSAASSAAQPELFAFEEAIVPGPVTQAVVAAPAPANDAPEHTLLDHEFAALLVRMNGGATHETLSLAARAASAARRTGHTCVPLASLVADTATARASLLGTCVVGQPGEWKPLILDEAERLYLQRYHAYEGALAASIHARLIAPPPHTDLAALEADLDFLLPPPAPDVTPSVADQRTAVRAAVQGWLSFITGGPGTGKTRTVAVLLTLLRHQAALHGGPALRILATAPTGKAAARLAESIAAAPVALPTSGPTAQEPVLTGTLHRILGLTGGNSEPRYHAEHPLRADVVIVDEASMVDLALMAKLFAAVPLTARLILLGDPQQLASVESGLVLSHLAEAAVAPGSEVLRERWLTLRENFRFRSQIGIRRICEAVNAGDAHVATAVLAGTYTADLTGRTLPAGDELATALGELAVLHYSPMLRAPDAAAALTAFGQFRILCAVREGRWGVQTFNRLCEAALAKAGLISPTPKPYAGQPIIITQNDYRLGLFNGDIGLILPDPAEGGSLRAFFAAPEGLRGLNPHRLPQYDPAWAMTVHKSQGSEFDRILLALPDNDVQVLTRELIYTGLTRARQQVELWASPTVLESAVARVTTRHSGLRDTLCRLLHGR